MVDEREGDVAAADLPRAFNRQSVWKRIAIVAAGPIANLLLAVLLFAGTYIAGIPGQRAVLAESAAGHPARPPRVSPMAISSSPSTAPRSEAGRTCAGDCCRLGRTTRRRSTVERPDASGDPASHALCCRIGVGRGLGRQLHVSARAPRGSRHAGDRRGGSRQARRARGTACRRSHCRDRWRAGALAGRSCRENQREARRAADVSRRARRRTHWTRRSRTEVAGARRAQGRHRGRAAQGGSRHRRAPRDNGAVWRVRRVCAGRAQDLGAVGVHAEDARPHRHRRSVAQEHQRSADDGRLRRDSRRRRACSSSSAISR